MNTTDYLINAAMVLVVLQLMRWNPVNLRNLLRPVVIVAAVGFYFLQSFPTAGNDLALDASGLILGGALGAACGCLTFLRRGDDGVTMARVGAAAAAVWIVGMGARIVFAYSSDHFGQHAITRFSIDNQITGASAWTVAFVLMALATVIGRLTVVRVRSHRLTSGAGRSRPLAA
ncbi:MAG TPA: hypothetical protein VHW26_02575 [Solirubrobacteraceae bacterium]|jgi:hypothetical protein|nr:hypothetical protein [Solirubrobacteraceae bacterium]